MNSSVFEGIKMRKHCFRVALILNVLALILFFLLLLFVFPVYATVITVPGDYFTIQGAIDAALEGDEIIVSPGTYYENISLKDGIRVEGAGPSMTIIDGGGSGAVVTVRPPYGETIGPGTVFEGFSVQNGSSTGIDGAGIEIDFASPVIRNNVLKNNEGPAVAAGGASTPQIENNILTQNKDGILLWASQPIIKGNIIVHNRGFGFETHNTHEFSVINNIIAENGTSGLILAIPWPGDRDMLVVNNTIVGNSGRGVSSNRCPGMGIVNNIVASNGDWGVYFESDFDWGVPIVDYNNVWGNTAGEYGGLASSGTHDISADPLFADADGGNYHLQANSPCIDAGCYIADLTEDIEGSPRPWDGTQEPRGDGSDFDIGADEFIFLGPTVSVPGDFPTIQAALNAALEGTEIIVFPGTYYENISFNGKNVILRSTDPTSQTVVQSTIIDGRSTDSVVTLSGTELANCTLSGFTITNGYDANGGGIYGNDTLATIRNNNITTNTAYGSYTVGHGGGLYKCDGTIQNNIISDNLARYGSGLYGCDGTIQHNIIYGNCAKYGGGLFSCHGTIQMNIISRNWASQNGGGLYECQGTIQNNVICGNAGGGICNCNRTILSNTISGNTGGGLYGCHGTIQNNTISGNLTDYSGGGLHWCNGTIENNIISDNFGGGLSDCRGTIQNNTITSNSADSGGGLSWCNGTLHNNIISGNSAFQGGGGLSHCDGTIQNNTISGNCAGDEGGGLHDCDGIIQNNTIVSNRASSGGGLSGCDGFIINCIIWADTASTGTELYSCVTPLYSCIEDWREGGRGNTSADPRFVDPINGDYHLGHDSPCIGAGNAYYLFGDYIADIDGECRIAGSSLDMGCDEHNSLPDSDGDLLANIVEITQGSDPNNPDTDGDGLKDGGEALRGTDPTYYNIPSGILIPTDYPSIQQGIFLAFPLEAITISPGTYYENLRLPGKDVVLQSINPMDDSIVDRTIIDGEGLYSVIDFKGTEYETCVVKGLTIRNGAAPFYGGGICGNGTHATIERNKIFGNSALGAYGHGGALHRCHGTIQNNTISSNTANIGGALCACGGTIQNNIISHNCAFLGGGGLWNCHGTIQNNIISSNLAFEDYNSRGGGLYNCDGTIQNNIISSNCAYYGGGVYGCEGGIRNNTIWGNSASSYGGGAADCRSMVNCILWENFAPLDAQLHYCYMYNFNCIQHWTDGGIGNISLDPQFVDPAKGNFHLRPNSPCIDAGCNVARLTEDFEGDPRPMDGTSEPRGDGSDFDIGADEFPGAFSLREYNFDLTEEGWGWLNIRLFTQPDFDYTPGCLILTAQDNTNTYGFWTSELDAVPVIAGCLYRAQWTVATDVTDPLAVPTMLLRVNCQNFQQADMLVVSSCGDGSYAPTPEGRTYEMYFLPPESCLGKPEEYDDLILSFDILNFDMGDAPDGSLMLDRVVVDAIPLDTLSTPTIIKTWSFDSGSEGWEFGSVPVFTAPLSGIGSGALWLIAQNNINTFGFWAGPSDEVEMETGKLYRLRFTVSTDVMDQERVPQLRLRVSSEDFQSSMVQVISSLTGAEMSPTPTGRTYDLYFYPPQSLVGTTRNGLLAAFDILNFDPTDSGSGALMLEGVVVESLDLMP